MARIDLLTAQMRQRDVKRVSVQSDEKIQLFDANDQLLGAGAALPHQTIHELLAQIAPVPLDGVPVAFPYKGRDGEFEVSVAPGSRGFEIRALSFATAQTEPLQNHSAPQTQIVAPAPEPVVSDDWFYLAGDQQIGPQTSSQMKALVRSGGVRRHTYVWRDGLPEWLPVAQSEFKNLLPTLPNPRGDSENIWYYRSMTGAPVPVDKTVLVEKIRSGELTGDAWVWQSGMPDWEVASATELASATNARQMGLPPVGMPAGGAGAPIASPTGGPRTLAGTGAYSVYGGGDPENTSGGGADVEVPKGARSWFNLGAFLFPVLWCHSMGMPSWGTAIFVLNIASRYIPYVYFVKLPVCVYLCVMGNRMAWQNRRFNSIEDFRRCQMIWGIVSAVVWGLLVLAGFLFYSWVFSQFTHASNSMAPTSGQTFSVPPTGTN